MLESSDLHCRCLFQGDAEQDLGTVAPWLVRLDRDDPFVRNLLTDSANPAPWHLWGYEPGIFVLSRQSFDAVWSHLRKFTRAPDESGQNFLVRFWDSDFLLCYLTQQHAGETPYIRSLFRPGIIDSFVGYNVFDGVQKLEFNFDEADWQIPPSPVFEQAAIDSIGVELANRRSARVFARNYPAVLNDVPMPELRDRISHARATSKAIGVDDEGLLGTFILLGVVYAPNFWEQDDFQAYWNVSRLESNARFKVYLDAVKAQLASSKIDFKAWW